MALDSFLNRRSNSSLDRYSSAGLYRYCPVGSPVMGFIDIGHAADADEFLDLIASIQFFADVLIVSIHQSKILLPLLCDDDNGDIVLSAMLVCLFH